MTRLLAFVCLLLLGGGVPAWAQTAPDITMDTILAAAPGDRALGWLTDIFGALFGGTATGLGEILKVFNAAVLAVGAVVVTYNMWAGVVQTAHEGQILGKRWSSLWAPVRVPLAMAAMVPGTGGYCAIQHLMASIVVASIGLANIVWSYSTDILLGTSGQAAIPLVRPTPPRLSDSDIIGVLDIYACAAVLNKTTEWQTAGKVTQAIVPITVRTSSGSTVYFGGTRQSGYPQNTCGSITLPMLGKDDAGTNQQVAQMHAQAIEQITNELSKGALAIATVVLASPDQTPAMPDRQLVANAVNGYKNAYANLVQVATSADQQMSQKLRNLIKTDGWTGAGAWYVRISEANAAVAGALNNGPIVAANPRPPVGGVEAERIEQARAAMGTWYSHAKSTVAGTAALEDYWDSYSANTDGDSLSVGSALGRVFDPTRWKWVYDAFSPGSGAKAGAGMALSNIITLGHRITITTEAAIGTYVTVTAARKVMADPDFRNSAAGAAISGVSAMVSRAVDLLPLPVSALLHFVGALLDALSPFLVLAAIALLASGWTLAYVVPMMPYFIWVLSCVSWLILVVEAIVAGCMWAFAHLRMDGEGISGGAGDNGYRITLQILLRPALMVIGMLAGMAVFAVAAQYIQQTYYTAMRSTLGSHYGFIDGLIVFLCMMVVFFVIMAERCFSLVHQLPDRIMRWVGGSPEGLNEEQHANTIKGAAVGITRSSTQSMQRLTNNAGGGNGGAGARHTPGSGGSDGAAAGIGQAEDRMRTGPGGPSGVPGGPGGGRPAPSGRSNDAVLGGPPSPRR
jgi:conjugal transfer/type IV secretion protein DotA/TraY